MLRVNSEVFRNNHHSLNRKESPFSLHSSKNSSMARARKSSTASLKENVPDLEKLIRDIKISPGLDTTTSSIKQICELLKNLESNDLVCDEVHAVHLLMQSIENKIVQSKTRSRLPSKASLTKDPLEYKPKELSDVSPIKQIEDASSRILYTNFSIKDLEKSISEENSLINSNKKSTVKIAVSKFEECEGNEEVEKLNSEIKYLERLLENKSKGANMSNPAPQFKKKSLKF